MGQDEGGSLSEADKDLTAVIRDCIFQGEYGCAREGLDGRALGQHLYHAVKVTLVAVREVPMQAQGDVLQGGE